MLRTKPCILSFVLTQSHPKKAMHQSPCFDIEYSMSYSPFLSRKSKWNKVQNTSIVLLLLKITPLVGVSTAESYCYGVYSYTHIYQFNIEDFVVEIYHGDILYFSFLRKQQKIAKNSFHTVYRVVRKNLLNFGLRI